MKLVPVLGRAEREGSLGGLGRARDEDPAVRGVVDVPRHCRPRRHVSQHNLRAWLSEW